ncbi:isocitrate dehydrogenase [NADP] [Blautia hydrogenotrophica CAG:147]|uniref:NADP-dependent isocitrate dehydrogenase n=2 Tax=Blautia hydrogenotrophica TaxID=53443 RepID=UPI0003354BCC|nr:NADP-dependent isocitrate dehydrogenase [Blautia hydrogenotrophica]MEE0462892.1 NADP-dependent isocitrate dehydrogenase [Blautia hydrogenotrophica]CCX60453.1 isocitrate dehydrogenase [NADP] [Blautia hydrogenotrophica CAG:147]CUM68715.1 3-isopropylmalate dehydrogenase [Blautia hydrogenotrophica]SCI19888.1 3-isopropylmalate dehydrogenase [uncultured Blautia sp.]
MDKIKMQTPLVEMDGDEMTRILWQKIKEELLFPFVELNTEYYDLGLKKRDETDDQITVQAAEATKKYGVAVKCATITPNHARMDEYQLKKMWKSPNGTIRAILDGTVFRTPIVVKGIEPCVKNWEKPITIARHAYGDIYKNTELSIEKPGKAELVFTGKDGSEKRMLIQEFKNSGVLMGMHNLDASVESFARSCFSYALDTKQDLWFGCKDTISKTYDARFKNIFEEIYEKEFKEKFRAQGLTYFYSLIDDIVARVMKAKGGFIWACKNYDGDVMSDMVSSAFGSLAMMTSVLVSPHGYYEYEAAHGTVQRHYYRHLKGEETSTNSVATIFAWTGALRKRGELDGNHVLSDFAGKLEQATIATIESGRMTKDLALITTLENPVVLNSEAFIQAVRGELEKLLAE